MFQENLALKSRDRILQLKDKHKGARIFCLGNGPSLKKTDLSLLKNEIVIGCNHVNKVFVDYGFFPQYCCITDRNRIIELRDDQLVRKSPTIVVSDHMSLNPDPNFFSQYEKDNYIFISRLSKKIYRPFSKLISILPISFQGYDIRERLIRRVFADSNQFSFDLTEGVNVASTVIFTTIQLAAYLGASEIYVLGVDADYKSNGQYCFEPNKSKFFTDPDFMTDPLKFMNPFFEIFDRDLSARSIKLFNATIGGRLDSINRKDYYSLF